MIVVLLAEDVDRNLEDQRVYKAKLVVLLAEDVDRNCTTWSRVEYKLVVLLAEDVDRNYVTGLTSEQWLGRPPRGGRG